MIPAPSDPIVVAYASLVVSVLALVVGLARYLGDLLSRPKHQHGREVEDLDALFRRPDLPEDTVPVVRPGTVYTSRNGRRG